MASPTTDQVRTLPAFFEQAVPEEYVDENGHMNITDYFRLGTWAPWQRMTDLGLGRQYIPERGLSFFTVQHHISYLSELRLGERFSVRTGVAGRTAKAVHSVAYVLDEARDRVSCALELMYVHVSMESRRSVEMPDDVAAVFDGEIDAHPWVSGAVGGLALRR